MRNNANCRYDKKCIFCSYWQGTAPNVNFRNGISTYKKEQAICSYKSNVQESDGCCRHFDRKLLYL